MLKKFFYRVFCGFFLGVSVFAPGFSGSVIAIAMGIYKDIVRIASNPFKKLKQNIIFCVPLGIGAAISAVLLILILKTLFDTYEKATYLLFIGLIAGNIPVIFSELKKCGFKKHYACIGTVTFVASLLLGIFAMGKPEVENPGMLLMALSGFMGGAALLIPGMSVSMVLMIMGVYKEQILSISSSLIRFNFENLIPFGLFCVCALAGLVLTSKGIKVIFEKFPGSANTAVLGFLFGSLTGILYQSLRMEDVNFNWLLGSVMLIFGLGVSILFYVLNNKFNKGSD